MRVGGRPRAERILDRGGAAARGCASASPGQLALQLHRPTPTRPWPSLPFPSPSLVSLSSRPPQHACLAVLLLLRLGLPGPRDHVRQERLQGRSCRSLPSPLPCCEPWLTCRRLYPSLPQSFLFCTSKYVVPARSSPPVPALTLCSPPRSSRCHKNFKCVSPPRLLPPSSADDPARPLLLLLSPRMKRNPRKVRWTKSFRKASGKEMTIVRPAPSCCYCSRLGGGPFAAREQSPSKPAGTTRPRSPCSASSASLAAEVLAVARALCHPH